MIVTAIQESLDKLSNDAFAAANARIEELSFEKDKWDVPWRETLTNLTNTRDLLQDLIHRGILVQMPLTVQRRILSELDDLSRFVSELNSGNDTLKNIVNTTEALYSYVWQNRLHNLSDQFLGFETKLNQLKILEGRAEELTDSLEDAVKLRQSALNLSEELQAQAEELSSKEASSTETLNLLKEQLRLAEGLAQDAAVKLKTISETEETIRNLQASSKTSNTEIASIEGTIRSFFEDIAKFKTSINDTTVEASNTVAATRDRANTLIDQNNQQTTELIDELRSLEIQINEHLQRATGDSLFHTFNQRRKVLSVTKYLWILGVIGFAIGIYISLSNILTTGLAALNNNDGKDIYLFLLRLSVNIPFGFGIYFCASQYNKERKLEEEYAFKSNISISLVPYEELVRKLMSVNVENTTEREKYTKFVIDAISNVFTSPTERVFSDHQSESGSAKLSKLSKPVTEILDSVKDLVKTAKD